MTEIKSQVMQNQTEDQWTNDLIFTLKERGNGIDVIIACLHHLSVDKLKGIIVPGTTISKNLMLSIYLIDQITDNPHCPRHMMCEKDKIEIFLKIDALMEYCKDDLPRYQQSGIEHFKK